MPDYVAIGSLGVAMLSLIFTFVKTGSESIKNNQSLKEKLNNIESVVVDIKTELVNLRNSITKHDVDIARIMSKLETHEQRLNNLEKE
jgi:peptidoglycan hydrolase CwlO-like protein